MPWGQLNIIYSRYIYTYSRLHQHVSDNQRFHGDIRMSQSSGRWKQFDYYRKNGHLRVYKGGIGQTQV